MKSLNCRLGDLAVTVKAAFPENLGRIVRIVGSHGHGKWWGFDAPTHLWEIEVIKGARIIYEYDNGSRKAHTRGLAPDAYLKPIAPVKAASKGLAISKAEEDDHAYV